MHSIQVFILFSFFALFACSTANSPIHQTEQDIRSLLDEKTGTYAVAFLDLSDTSNFLLINENQVFHAASTMKTPVMMEIFKQAQEGRFSLYDKIQVKNEFRSIVDGSPYSLDINQDSEQSLYHSIGSEMSIYDLMYKMIINSSNLATNILIEKTGAEQVTRTMRELGAMDIKILRGVEDIKAYRKGLSNTTTAYDLMLVYKNIGQNDFLDEVSCRRMTNILLEQQHNDLIPALLPQEVRVAHKTGYITKILHDSGIVILPNGQKYVLVVLSKEWRSVEEATQTIAQISKIVYDYYTEF